MKIEVFEVKNNDIKKVIRAIRRKSSATVCDIMNRTGLRYDTVMQILFFLRHDLMIATDNCGEKYYAI